MTTSGPTRPAPHAPGRAAPCASRQCAGGPAGRPPAAGRRVCPACAVRVRADLVALPAIHADREPAPLPRRRPDLQRVSGGRPESGLPLDEDGLAARTAILSLLASWSALVADERGVGRPASRTPGDLTRYLLRHLDWLLDHPAAADFVEEVTRTAHAARRRSPHDGAGDPDVGDCVSPGCGARLTVSRAGTGPARAIRCGAGHTWQPHQWLRLSRQLQHRGGAGHRPRRPGHAED